MLTGDGAHDEEAESCAADARAVPVFDTIETMKDALQHGRRDADALVGDAQHGLFAVDDAKLRGDIDAVG